MERPVPDVNRPRVEPEIIPPGQPDPRSRRGPAFDGRGTQRVYVAQVGPFGFAMVALVVAIILALVFLLVLGVIFIPLAGALLAAAVLLSLFRGAFRRRY
jgi:hypothetical protein